jgi:hypothetical protein
MALPLPHCFFFFCFSTRVHHYEQKNGVLSTFFPCGTQSPATIYLRFAGGKGTIGCCCDAKGSQCCGVGVILGTFWFFSTVPLFPVELVVRGWPLYTLMVTISGAPFRSFHGMIGRVQSPHAQTSKHPIFCAFFTPTSEMK